MPKKRRTSGYGGRIERAMREGPRPVDSVRGLARRLEADDSPYRDLRGATYGGVRQYIEENVSRPRLELLRALADVLGVRADWLAFGEGRMTEHEALAERVTAEERAAIEREVLSNIESAVFGALVDELPRMRRGLQRTRTRLVGILDQVVSRVAFMSRQKEALIRHGLDSEGRAVTGHLYGLEQELKETAVREVARAVRGPAQALGVDLDELGEEHFALYVDAIATAIGVLIMQSPGGNHHG
jgi:transcriptional regulator with XRE-family HTH domain